MSKAFISIGSNLGDKKSHCQKAIFLLNALPQTEVKKVSSFYLTEPVEEKAQPWFINLAVYLETDLSPFELFSWLKYIEKFMGRFTTWNKGPRIIDLDFLLYDELVINTKSLILPHPYLHERGFVLTPLVEVAEEQTHPVFKCSIKELWSECKYKEWVIKIK